MRGPLIRRKVRKIFQSKRLLWILHTKSPLPPQVRTLSMNALPWRPFHQPKLLVSDNLHFTSPIAPSSSSQTMLLPAISSAPFFCSVRLSNPIAANSRNIAIAVSTQASATNSSYSVSDKDLESRGFKLHRTVSDLNLDHLNSVFAAVGFPKRDPDKIRIALDNTDALLWIQYGKTQRPVAFARATGDGVFNAIIWDVVVDPSFQGLGLGKAVIERIIEDLLRKGISNIALYSEPRVLGFYRPLGFVADPDGIRGMVYARKKKKN